jgi:hypothetical protein
VSRVFSLLSRFGPPLLFCALLLYHFIRLFFGVDFFDEAYWVAFQWRFSLGDRPYVDERSFHQNFAVFLYPFVSLFRLLSKGPDGLVLFTRSVFFVATAALSCFTVAFFRKSFGVKAAWLMGCLFLLFPNETPNFSYASMGLYGIYFGALLIFWGDGVTWRVPLAGLVHAIAVASDPSQIPTALVLGMGGLWGATQKKQWALAYAAPFLTVAVLMLSYAGREGILGIWESALYLDHSTFSVHFFRHAKDLFAVPYRPLWGVFLALGCFVIFGRFTAVVPVYVSAIPLACLLVVLTMGYGSRFYFAYLGIAGMLLLISQGAFRKEHRTLMLFFVSALVSSLCYAWAGNRGGVARFGLGMGLAMLATQCTFYLFLSKVSPRFRLVPTGMTVAALIALTLSSVPYEGTARFESGPYQGLYTSQAKVEWLTRLHSQIAQRADQYERILFHPHFPAGYLLTSLKPASGNVWWTYPLNDLSANAFMRDFERYSPSRRLVVKVKELFYHDFEINRCGENPMDEIGEQLEKHWHRSFASASFDVYEKTPIAAWTRD